MRADHDAGQVAVAESDGGEVFDRALGAAAAAFQTVLDDHFGRTFDATTDDDRRLLDEYRASAQHLRNGAAMHLRTGLIDADFTCWHSGFADENFAEDAAKVVDE